MSPIVELVGEVAEVAVEVVGDLISGGEDEKRKRPWWQTLILAVLPIAALALIAWLGWLVLQG